MTDVVTAIQSAIQIVGKLRALSKKIQDADFSMLLAQLTSDLADAKLQVSELKLEVARLTEQNQDLGSRLALRESAKPTIMDGTYAFQGDKGPFCTACFDVRSNRVRLTALHPPFNDLGRWQCPACQAIY